MKTVEQLENELEDLWNDFEKIQLDSMRKTDTIRALRAKIREMKAEKSS
jgi:hypothetical protein